MDIWMGIAVAGLIGFALGALVMWGMSRKQSGGTSVASLKKEHEQFREQVTDHFVETAERINRLTDSYKDLFDHLSQGAETLVDDASLRERMPQVSDQEVRLKRLGTQSRSPAASEGAAPASAGRPSSESSDASSNGGSSAGRGDEKPSEPDASDRETERPGPESTGKAGSSSPSEGSGSSDKPEPAAASGAKAGSPSSSAGSDSSDKPKPAPASSAKARKPAD